MKNQKGLVTLAIVSLMLALIVLSVGVFVNKNNMSLDLPNNQSVKSPPANDVQNTEKLNVQETIDQKKTGTTIDIDTEFKNLDSESKAIDMSLVDKQLDVMSE